MKKIGIIVGSLHQESINRKLAETIMKIGQDLGEFRLIDITKIPLFSEDLEKTLPQSVTEFRNAVRQNDLILILTPEYNRSIPGVLKNVLDWGSRPFAQSCFSGKEVAVGGASPGAVATAAAQVHLRSILTVIGFQPIHHPELYLRWHENILKDDGLPADPKTEMFLRRFVEALVR